VSQSVEAFKNAWRIPELRQRIVFTLVMLAIYRLGAHIPTPGVDGNALANLMSGRGGLLSFYDMFTGGAFEQATVFALGIMPYISASIIMQLLVAVVPSLERLAKEGQEGQKKITEITRYATIGLCLVQSAGIAAWLKSLDAQSPEGILAVGEGMGATAGFYLMCILTFTTGTAFIMWLGEQISEHGVGNGISLIIFISIVARAPQAVFRIFELFQAGELDIFYIGIMILVLIGVVAGVILVTLGQRRIPVQYPRQVKGRRSYGGGKSYLPLRVNQAGVIPIIFASSLLMLPSMLAGFVNIAGVEDFVQNNLNYDSVLYNTLYAGLIIFFCFFYTAITFNPIEMADNLKKYGGVVMGVRPGKATADYLNKVMTRVTVVGALFLAFVALVPQIVNSMLGIQDFLVASFFGGTSLLILVGVGLDTVRQIEQHLVMRNYEGFMRGRRFPGRR
jgi:preprotein translocase subunit SecY